KLVSLWNLIMNLIHSRHRGVPVSFANTMIGDFIDMDLFDMTAYNAYIYNPVTLSHSHGYAGFLRFLKSRRSPEMPMVITEFGLSVSPGNTGGQYGYGGNTEEEQAEGDLLMYRGLIDAGAQGGCIFQYHDGWFKAGNEWNHDSSPEEWFGLIAFSNASDHYGTPRPAWNAFAAYNKAVIVNPKNGGIYSDAVPVEIFAADGAASFTVQRNGIQVSASLIEDGYYKDEMNGASGPDPEDAELVFTFLDSEGQILKNETITVLLADENMQLPRIDLEITPAVLAPGQNHTLNMEVLVNPVFSVEPARLDYVMHPHIGWDPGIARSKTLSFQNNSWSGQDNFFIPSDCRVATFGAGMTIRYGKFSKRIFNQRILTAGDWAGSLAAEESSSSISGAPVPGMQDLAIYPNPFNSTTRVRFMLAVPGEPELTLYDAIGRCLKTIRPGRLAAGFHSVTLDGSELATGVYVIRIHLEGRSEIRKMVLIR
ncbi:T9SS type A sorting domain-containing protein, partial [bacterium]|nr:T9SS type A sorting domain-containing protein [bacterium]